MKTLIQAVVVTLFVASTAQAQQAVQWRVEDGGNGHWYQLRIGDDYVSWTDARDSAAARGGHLASISSSQESDWVGTIIQVPAAWTNGGYIGPWLGGYQDRSSADFSEPAGGWRWTSGEPWTFAAWDSIGNQPSNGPLQGEDFLHYSSYSPQWNDIRCCDGGVISYVIEWSADCNGDGIVDYGQILDGTLADLNGNGVPDCCENGGPCAADPLSSGLQAYLKFDGNCVDSSSFGRNGIPTGVQFVRDRFNSSGKAAYFDGATTDVQIQGVPIPVDNAFSWSMWIRTEPMPYGVSGVPILQRIESVGNNLVSPSLWLRADGRISFYSYLIGPGAWELDTPPAAIQPGNWVHLACTSANSGDRRIYLNGTLVAQGVAPNYGQELGLLLIGRDRLDSSPRLRASIDELRIYSRSLSAAEVVAIRDLGSPAVPTCVDADLFRDFNVNGADLGILLSQWGPNTTLTVADINDDGVVDGADLGILLSFWGACP